MLQESPTPGCGILRHAATLVSIDRVSDRRSAAGRCSQVHVARRPIAVAAGGRESLSPEAVGALPRAQSQTPSRDDATRITLVVLSRLIEWRTVLTIVKPDTLIRWRLRVFKDLPHSAPTHVLLATDLHAGNVLRAQREPWLVIDPKPFVGDPAYDATQHLRNCDLRLRSDPDGTIRRFADLVGVDDGRVRLWLFARAAAEPRDNWNGDSMTNLARAIAP